MDSDIRPLLPVRVTHPSVKYSILVSEPSQHPTRAAPGPLATARYSTQRSVSAPAPGGRTPAQSGRTPAASGRAPAHSGSLLHKAQGERAVL